MAERMRTQDVRATSQPLYCVLLPERVYGVDLNYSPEYVWMDQNSGDYVEASPEEAIQLEALEEAGEETILDGYEYEKIGYVVKERFITASLTEEGAKEHLRLNGHNLKGAHIYVTSLHRTPDMIALREWLMSLTEPPTKPTTGETSPG
jgi:hypothetical protein